MIKWINKNVLYIAIAILLSVTSILFYKEDIASAKIIIAILTMGIISFLVLSNKKYAIYAIITLAPTSLPLYIEILDFKLSFPTEFLTLLLIITSGITLIFSEKFNKRIVFHPISIILFLDILLTIIAASFSEMALVSVKRILLKTSYIAVYFFIFSHWTFTVKNRSLLFFLYAIGLIYPVYSTLINHAAQNFSVATSFAMCQPYYSDHTIYGACIAFILPFLLFWLFFKRKDKNKWFIGVFVLTILLCAAEILSYSRASWISLIGVIMFILLLRFKLKISHLIVGFSLVSLVIAFNIQTIFTSIKQQETNIHTEENISDHLGSVTNLQTDASNLERINRWVCAIRMFDEKPFFGFGPGTYQFEYGKFQSINYMTRISTHDGKKGNAHSEYLTYLSESGFFAFSVFLILVFYSIHIGLKCYYHFKENTTKKTLILGALCGLITFFIHGLFNTFIDNEKMAILVYGSLSILVVFDIERRKLIAAENNE